MEMDLGTIGGATLCDDAAQQADCNGGARGIDVPRVEDGDGFELIYDRLRERIRLLALRIVEDEHDAEDVVQETFLAVIRWQGTLRDPRALEGWVLQVARNRSLDRVRRRRRCRPSPRAHEEESDRDPAVPRVLRRSGSAEACAQSVARFREALGTLPDSVRETVRLRYVVGLSCEEIAAVQGLGDSCVKTRLHRARARLRAAVEV